MQDFQRGTSNKLAKSTNIVQQIIVMFQSSKGVKVLAYISDLLSVDLNYLVKTISSQRFSNKHSGLKTTNIKPLNCSGLLQKM